MKNKIEMCLLVLTLAYVGQACTMARMHISKPFRASTEEIPVDRPSWSGLPNETYRLGQYTASKINRSAKTTSTIGYSYFKTKDSLQEFSFTFSDSSGQSWENQCVIQEGHKIVGIFEVDKSHTLRCSLFMKGEEETVTTFLELESVKVWPPNERNGWLTMGDQKVKIRLSREMENSVLPPGHIAGYYFAQGLEQIGAVEVIDPGTVYLRHGLQPEVRRSLAAASVVLMVFERL